MKDDSQFCWSAKEPVPKNGPRKRKKHSKSPKLGVDNRGLSLLEIYLLILKVLSEWDSLTQEQTMEKAGLNLASPKKYLSFLVRLGLLLEGAFGSKTCFSITPKGLNVVAYFRLMDDKSVFFGSSIVRID